MHVLYNERLRAIDIKVNHVRIQLPSYSLDLLLSYWDLYIMTHQPAQDWQWFMGVKNVKTLTS